MSKFKTTSKRFALLTVAAIAIAACGGSSENSSTESTAAGRTKNAALTCAQGGTCAVGDTGPGGGIVFYIATANFTSGAPCGTACRALEAAPAGWITSPSGQANCTTAGTSTVDPKCEWSGNTTTAIGSTARGTAIGTGFANTSAITKQNSTQGKAATVAKAYQGGGKTDWFLPSRDELSQMSGKFMPDGDYWSSTEYAITDLTGQSLITVWAQYITLGSQPNAKKASALYVRPVRAFSATATPTYKVGDTGPGGGTVYVQFSQPFASQAPCGATCRYLEVAPVGWIVSSTPSGQTNCFVKGTSTSDPRCLWSGNTGTRIGTTGSSVGSGYGNTSAIIAQNSTAGMAATAARAYRGGGKTDWFLPSIDELKQLAGAYLSSGITMDKMAYFSSTETSYKYASNAYSWEFKTMGNIGEAAKEYDYGVRPVRAF